MVTCHSSKREDLYFVTKYKYDIVCTLWRHRDRSLIKKSDLYSHFQSYIIYMKGGENMGKNYLTRKTITFKRAIKVTEDLKQFIFYNSNYRRRVWNDFVEEYYRCKNNSEKFDPLKYSVKYYNDVEKNDLNYKTYAAGIRDSVTMDIKTALKISKSKNNGKLHFKKFRKFQCSFKVQCKSQFVSQKGMLPKFNSRVYIIDGRYIRFRVNRQQDPLFFECKESFYYDSIPGIDNKMWYYDKNKHCYFREEDVKEISFIHENGKFYVGLVITVTYVNSSRDIKKRLDVAGIDLGIHTPICLYYGDSNKFIEGKMSDKELRRIHYLERRTKRLQQIMDKKKYGSNNYYKVLKKFNITWTKIRNIRRNWQWMKALLIAKNFKLIVVDDFEQPIDSNNTTIPKYILRHINHNNRIHGVCTFNEILKHACKKYGCKYIKAPENTTRMCNKCSHLNPHLPLSTRTLICEACGHTIDRDHNASQNCYDYAFGNCNVFSWVLHQGR